MARYSHKGHDNIRYDITQNIAIQYDPKVLHCMQELHVVSYKLQLYRRRSPIFTAPTRSFEVGHWPTADESSSPTGHSAGVS